MNFQKTVQSLVEIFKFRMERAVTKQDVYHYGKELLEEAEGLRQAQGLTVDYERVAELDGQLLIHDKHEIVVNDEGAGFQTWTGPWSCTQSY